MKTAADGFCTVSGSSFLCYRADGEHWFHTETQLAVLQEWEKAHL